MTGAFYSGRYTALVFEAVTGDTAWQQFALFVDELEQKVGIFVINVFDTEFAETAIFFLCFSPIFGLLRNFTSSLEAAIVKDIVEKWMVKVGENG